MPTPDTTLGTIHQQAACWIPCNTWSGLCFHASTTTEAPCWACGTRCFPAGAPWYALKIKPHHDTPLQVLGVHAGAQGVMEGRVVVAPPRGTWPKGMVVIEGATDLQTVRAVRGEARDGLCIDDAPRCHTTRRPQPSS